MAAGSFAQGRWLRLARSKGIGVARLLLLAFALQLLSPLVDAAPPVHIAALEADIAASLCHDGANGAAAAPADKGDSHGVKHCIFCLPLVGGHAAHLGESILDAPPAALVGVVRPLQDRQHFSHRRAFAFARAPPAGSPTV